MKPVDISIVIPSIRVEHWERVYDSLAPSCGKYIFELIFVGPKKGNLDFFKEDRFIWVEDFGSPCRCGQLGTTYATGEYITWGSDDGYFLPNSIEKAIDFHKTLRDIDVIAMRYKEGPNFSGGGMPDDWFRARHHADQRLPGILDSFMIAPVAMYKLDYFRELGGWDCQYEHLNMSCHDLAFRAQKNGSKVYLSPEYISTHDQTPSAEDYQPMQHAYWQNDLPLFRQQYAVYDPFRINIPYSNWKNSPEIWNRRNFTTMKPTEQ